MLGGGGFLLANGCYTVMFAQFIFGDEKPEKVSAHGQLSQDGMACLTIRIFCVLQIPFTTFANIFIILSYK